MIDPKYLELIHGELDGANTEKESALLRDYLASNPEARELYSDLSSLTTLLKKFPEVEPSADLRKRILNSISAAKGAPRQRPRTLRLPIRTPLFGLNLKMAYAVIAGIALGVIGYSLLMGLGGKGSSIDISNLYGTITSGETPAGLRIEQQVSIALDQASGSAAIKSSDRVVLVDLHLKTAGGVDCVIRFSEDQLSFKGFAREKDATGQLQIGNEQLRFGHADENRYVIGFEKRSEEPVSVTFQLIGKEGSVLFEKALSTKSNEP
jgi:hypothetical protein